MLLAGQASQVLHQGLPTVWGRPLGHPAHIQCNLMCNLVQDLHHPWYSCDFPNGGFQVFSPISSWGFPNPCYSGVIQYPWRIHGADIYIYMLTFTINIPPMLYSIYTSTMDPSWGMLQPLKMTQKLIWVFDSYNVGPPSYKMVYKPH